MSTKTTIKRLALVTVAALGLGVLSVAPSSAVAQLDSISVSAASTTQVAGETRTASSVIVTGTLAGQKGVDTLTITATIASGPAYVAPLLVRTETTTSEATAGAASAVSVNPLETATITQGTAKWALYLNAPTVAGTYVVRLTPTGGTNAVATSVSITVSPKTLGWRTAFIDTGTATPSADAASALSYPAAAATAVKASITTRQGYGATAGSNLADAADAEAVTVTTDKGLVSSSAGSYFVGAAKTVTVAAATAATNTFYIYSNGDIGKATITITIGTQAAITKNVTFVGPATTLVATASSGNKGWTGIGAGKETIHLVSATDAAGGATTRPAGLTVASSDTSVATVAITNNETVTVTGVKAGTATITVTDPATTGKATAATYVVTVKANKPATAPTITFDKTSYAVGEIITMTVNADMADSATAQLFTAALVTSATVTTVPGATGLPAGGQHAIVSGKVDYKFYAPAVSGSFTITGTGGSDIDLTTLVTAPTVTKTVDIVNPGVDAATAAAELAEAAAQDATDAALDATEAATLAGALAQEAVDAVADLSTQVATLIAELKKQITTLTNLVIKIQKKVKA